MSTTLYLYVSGMIWSLPVLATVAALWGHTQVPYGVWIGVFVWALVAFLYNFVW